MTLRERIQQEIHERGPIPFSQYMEMCLYDPDLGYYSRDVERFGKAGDFYTSSDVHAVFGRLLARQFEEIWRVLGSPGQIEILELGPGRGLFARDLLDWSEKKFPGFFRALHYSLLEKSTALQRRLQANLERHFIAGKTSLSPEGLKHHISRGPYGMAEAMPLANLPAATEKDVTSVVPSGDGPGIFSRERALAREIPVIIFANEFFDALPVEVLSPRGELRIGIKDGRFVETWAPASSDEMEFLDRYSVQPEDGERVEVPLLAQRYMAKMGTALTQGIIIVVDYGYTREETLAGRHRGTLMAFRQHSVSASPYEAPGDQDITAHVHFTALTAAAEQDGMQVQPLLTQSQFLMGIGEQNQFADAFEDCRLLQETAKVALQLKHLVTPAGMGEAFHVLVCSKGIDPAKVVGLSGLSFSKCRI